jgi:hypothetical protein
VEDTVTVAPASVGLDIRPRADASVLVKPRRVEARTEHHEALPRSRVAGRRESERAMTTLTTGEGLRTGAGLSGRDDLLPTEEFVPECVLVRHVPLFVC